MAQPGVFETATKAAVRDVTGLLPQAMVWTNVYAFMPRRTLCSKLDEKEVTGPCSTVTRTYPCPFLARNMLKLEYHNSCPCLRCTVKIIQTGVKEVVYNLSYRMWADFVHTQRYIISQTAGMTLPQRCSRRLGLYCEDMHRRPGPISKNLIPHLRTFQMCHNDIHIGLDVPSGGTEKRHTSI
jgi:hypothetical protein